MATATKTDKVLTALQEGQEMTSAQISARWDVPNVGAVIQNLRFKGHSVYLNTHTDTKGRVTRKYRMGTPSRRVVAAGYKALAEASA
jgi:predicted transcriptional regulator